MPCAITLTGVPRYEPVNPHMLRTSVTRRGASNQFSAMYCALKGSPGMRTVSAKSPGAAFMCLVAMLSMLLLGGARTIPRCVRFGEHPPC